MGTEIEGPMQRSLTDRLCTQCGLCCDGTLLADVELAGRKEATRMELLGLMVDEDEEGHGLLPLPCSALSGKMCGIYAHRPKTCRTFECRLLQNAQSGAVSVARAQEQIVGAFTLIGRLKRLLSELGDRNIRLPLKERCSDLLARSDVMSPRHVELESAMCELEGLIQKTFFQ
jgi:Fe-S-cluster containining protein